MSVELFDYQEEAIDKLKTGSILCGGVGSGKSRTSLAYFYLRECNGFLPSSDSEEYPRMETPKDLYIITTAKKRDSLEWQKELIPFLLSTDPAISPCKVVIDSWNNIQKYIGVEKAFFIFDEQRLVGSGVWVQSFLKISKKNNWILLSATPGDTWMDYLPVFMANGFYNSRREFESRHVIYSRYVEFPKIEKYIGTAYLNKLKESLLVRTDYVRKANAHNKWILVGYDEDRYKRVWTDRWDIFENKPIKNHSAACYLVRKVVNANPERVEQLDRLYSTHPRMIVFYNFTYELESLIEYANSKAIPYSQWNGKKHEDILDGDTWLYFVQYTACEGWNCITTDTIVFFSLNYSYRIVTQAAGRIDRLNSPYKDLYYYHLYSESEIDKGIRDAYHKKKVFNEKDFVSNKFEKVISGKNAA